GGERVRGDVRLDGGDPVAVVARLPGAGDRIDGSVRADPAHAVAIRDQDVSVGLHRNLEWLPEGRVDRRIAVAREAAAMAAGKGLQGFVGLELAGRARVGVALRQ